MSDLKPCPMCGETQIKLIDWPADNSIYEVFCLSCKINTGAKFTKKEAILHWNTRSYEQRIAKLEELLKNAAPFIEKSRRQIVEQADYEKWKEVMEETETALNG